MDRVLGRHRRMTMRVAGWAVGLCFSLISFGTLAASPPCVTLTTHGIDDAMARELITQLRNELGAPLLEGDSIRSCSRLRIEIADKTAVISLDGDRPYETVLQLDDLLPTHWTRAIALSSAGLLALQATPPEAGKPLDEAPDRPSSKQEESRPSEEEPSHPRRTLPDKVDKMDTEKRGETATDTISGPKAPPRVKKRLRLFLHGGGHVVAAFGTWLGALLPGFGVPVGPLDLDLAISGIWGRKSVNLGRVYTAGIGARVTLWWRTLEKASFFLRLGPAVEALWLWGYGRPLEQVTSHRAAGPVVNLIGLFGGSFLLSSRVALSLALGGGGAVLHFISQADGREVAGLAGGVVTLQSGIEFTL